MTRLTIGCLLALLFGSAGPSSAVTTILQAGVSHPMPGLCLPPKTYNMSQLGIISATGNSAESPTSQIGLRASADFPPQGTLYWFVGPNGAAVPPEAMDLHLINVPSFSLSSTTSLGFRNDPDASQSSQASGVNVLTSRWVQAGRQSHVTGCPSTACVHIRTFNGGTLDQNIVDQNFAINSIVQATADVTHTYFTLNITGDQRLARYAMPNYAFSFSVSLGGSGAQQCAGNIANDTNAVFCAFSPNIIKRIPKATMVVTDNTYAGVQDFRGLAYDQELDVLYAVGRESNAEHLYLINPTTMGVISRHNLSITGTLQGILIDPGNNKLYLPYEQDTTTFGGLVRVNRTTKAVEQTFTGTLATPQGRYAQLFAFAQRAYLSYPGSGGVAARVQQVNLCQ